jgi:glutamate carboxypeptidase
MQDILAQVQQDLPQTLRLLGRMVNMDSPSLEKALVDRFVRFVGAEFESVGGRAEYIEAERFGDHLVARFEGESRQRVLLLGHTDTVFSAGEAARRPFRIERGVATGPGVFDMKAGIALMLAALRALRTLRPLPKSVTVLLTSDEELGSPSSRDLIQAEALQASAVLVLEPSLPGGALKTARKGVGRFTIKAIGRAAHAGIDPENGINAVEEIAGQVLRLQRMSDRSRGTTVTVGMIQGGTRPNVVPAEAAVELDVRVGDAEEAERITRAIRDLQPSLSGARLEIRGGINRPPMERTPDTVRLFTLARSVAQELNMDLTEGSTGGASDGNLTSALGVPTLDGLGAIGTGAHSLTESVETTSLASRAALIAGLIERI